MKKNVLTWFSAALMCAALMFSCDDPENVVHVTSITLTPQTLNLTVGQTHQLVATVKPEEATYKQVVWSSSNSSVASVPNVMSVPEAVANEMIAGKATVTAVAAGTATITAMSFDGELTSTCQVTVTDNTPAKSIVLGNQVGLIDPGKANQLATFTVTTTGIPSGEKLQEVLWFDETGTNQVTKPTALNFYLTDLQTFTVTQLEPMRQDLHLKFLIVIDGVQSNKADLIIKAIITKSVTVESQVGALLAGVVGSVTFPVKTANIANGNYVASVANLPTGVTVSGNVTIANNAGTLTLTGSAQSVAGVTSNLRLTIDSTQSNAFTLTVSPSNAKSVTVESQVGTLTAGVAGTVTFPVKTTNIASGTYEVTVENLPTGVTFPRNITILNSGGTLTLTGNTQTIAGVTSNLRLTIDGTQSNTFTLTISPYQSIVLGNQNGTIDPGKPDQQVTYAVTTTGIPAGSKLQEVLWFDETGTRQVDKPTALNFYLTNLQTFTVTQLEPIRQDIHLKILIVIDGVQSNKTDLIIKSITGKIVTVENQVGTLLAGVVGSVTFPVKTTGIANGTYDVSVPNLPLGVTPSRNITIENNVGTLTLSSNAQSVAGVTSNLRLTIDGTQSNAFTVTVSQAGTKSVTVESQVGTLLAGVAGTVTFPVKTTGIANGNYVPSVANLPTGVAPSTSVNLVITNGVGTLTLAGNAQTVAGVTSTLRLTIDGTQSNAFTLTVSQAGAKSVTVENQVGALAQGTAGSATFVVRTENIATNMTGEVTWVDAQGNPRTAPGGITASITTGNANRTLTMTTTIQAPSGQFYFRVTIDGTLSNIGTLTIDTKIENKSVTVESQVGALAQGTAGSATFAVRTENIATNMTGEVTWVDAQGNPRTAPAGITASVSTGNVNRTLTMTTTIQAQSGQFYFRVMIDGTHSNIGTLTIDTKIENKSVTVENQVGTLAAGTAGSATFAVRTENIATNMTGQLTWVDAQGNPKAAPAGVSTSVTTGNVNRTLTVTTTTGSESGQYYFRVMIDGTHSNIGTLTIDNKLVKTVTVESQVGTLSEGTAGQATFAVGTTNIATNMTGQVTWVDAQGNPKAAPGGVNTSVSTGNVNRTLTVTTTTNAQFGQYYFYVVIDGAMSNMGTLTIEAKQIVKTVTVEGQVGELVAGVQGDVTFPVKTTNIANGTYDVTYENRPFGVTGSRTITISNGTGTLTFTSTMNTVPGVTSNLRITIDGTQSNAFTLTIVSCVKSVVIKSGQENPLTAGIDGKTFYDVSTSCIPTSATCQIQWYASPKGGGTVSAPQGFEDYDLAPGSEERKLTLAFSPSTKAGTYYFAISMENVVSNIVALTIDAPTKSIELGNQNGVLVANKPGVATFEVKTTGISTAIKEFEVWWYNEAGALIKRPAWVVWTDPDRILTNGSEKRTLTIETTSSAAQCNYKILISIDGVQSNKSDFIVINP